MEQLQNAIQRQFDLEKQGIVYKLEEEVQELRIAFPLNGLYRDTMSTNLDVIQLAINGRSVTDGDESDFGQYENYVKDSEIGELGDIITVCMTRLQFLNINIENLLDMINVYNRLRD